MNVTQFTMDPIDAHIKADAYQQAIAEGRAYAGDEDLAVAYRAIERGKVIIDLHTAMAETGINSDGRPRLAICRADAKQCLFYPRQAALEFHANRWHSKGHHTLHTSVPRRIFGNAAISQQTATATVPSIPPGARPRGHLDRYQILWEAVWQPQVPVDPFLLKQLTGTLYVVLAQWNLTPLEQAVLRNRVMP